ncbi:hypothetical protein PAMA_016157 [Pampus argenteus]
MIMLLCWSMLLLCLSANAEDTAICQDSGEKIQLKCSSAGCPNDIKDYVGMYLYVSQNCKEKNVLYYHPYPQSKDKITPSMRYKDRIQTNGSLVNHIITISNLTVTDSGVYRCVYKRFPEGECRSNVYTVLVKEGVPQMPLLVSTRGGYFEEEPSQTPYKEANAQSVNQQCPFLPLIISATCAISTLMTMIFILLIVPKVKRCTCSTPQGPNDCVYEVMTKNRVRHPAAAEQSSSGPSDYS